MASQVVTNCKLYVGEYDWSGDMNVARLDYAAELKDATAFGQTARINKGGLKTVSLNSEGFWSAGSGEIDSELFGVIGTSDKPVTVLVGSGAEGDDAYFFRSIRANYTPGAQVGEMFRFGSTAQASGGAGLVRGKVMAAGTGFGAVTLNGTAFQLGAVSATQSIYAALHVYVASASDTLDVKIQSDNAENFSTPTDRITFTQAGAVTSEWKSTAGAITDDWWRAVVVGAGTGVSFSYIVSAGIL